MRFYAENFNEFFAQALHDDHVGLFLGIFHDRVVSELSLDKLSVSDIEKMLSEAETQVEKEQDVLRFSNLVTMRGVLYQAKIEIEKSFIEMNEKDYRLAIGCFEKAMQLGNVTAIAYCAYLISKTELVQTNYLGAINLYEKAISLGNAMAMSNRAFMYTRGHGGPINYPAAIQLYEMAISLDCTSAMNNRACMYRDGEGGSINYSAAISLLEQAIKLGDLNALSNRAMMYKHGQGGPINYPAAIELYEKAIKLGSSTAMNNRAYMHQHGTGGPVNFPVAIELYEKAIKLGCATAMNNRAVMHEEGRGGPTSYAPATYLYEQAIKLGLASAMCNRGLMHAQAVGGPVNYPAAIDLYERAIALGFAPAMVYRARLYQLGLGGSLNYPKAIELYEKAIALGNSIAMNNRAHMHEHGLGGSIDYPRACALYEKAIALDSKPAMYNYALMHFDGKAGAINYAACLSLLRRLSKLIAKEECIDNDNLKTNIKDLLSKIAVIENKDVYTQYQWLMMQYEDSKISFNLFIFFRSHPAAFIKFIAADAALSEAEKNTIISLLVDCCVKHHTSIKQQVEKDEDKDAVNKKAAFEAIANYFIAQVDKAMIENPIDPNKILAYLAEVPSVSSAYRSALEQEADLLNSLVRDRELPLAEKFAIFSRIEYAHREILQIDATLLRDKAQALETEMLALEKNKDSKLKLQALNTQNSEVQEKVKMIESLLQGHEDKGLLKSLNWQEVENKNVLLYLQRKIDYASLRQTLKEECIEKLNQQLSLAEREKNNFTSQYKLFSNKLSIIVKVQAIQKLLNLLQGNNSQEAFLPQELTTLKTYTLSKIMAEYKVLFPEGLHAESKTLSKKITNF